MQEKITKSLKEINNVSNKEITNVITLIDVNTKNGLQNLAGLEKNSIKKEFEDIINIKKGLTEKIYIKYLENIIKILIKETYQLNKLIDRR